MTEQSIRVGSRINRDAVVAERPCVVALVHTARGEKRIEKHLKMGEGDVLMVVRRTIQSDGRFPAPETATTGDGFTWHNTTS